MRNEGDTWDITTSVGTTALFVAAARAIESERKDKCIDDPLARPLVQAACHRHINLETMPNWPALFSLVLQQNSGALALRTYAIDEAIISHPTEQLVILAAGLDSRPFRLDLPEHTVVFDNDVPDILRFKHGVYNDIKAVSKVDVRLVSADLRDNWVQELISAGFNPQKTTTWLTEGLLPYLPVAAQHALMTTIKTYSSPGSRWICDYANMQSLVQNINNPAFRIEGSFLGLDFLDLFYDIDNQPSREDLFSDFPYSSQSLWDVAQKINFSRKKLELSSQQKIELQEIARKDPANFPFIDSRGDVSVSENDFIVSLQGYEIVIIDF